MLTLGACSNAPASTEAKEESNTAAAQSTEEQETEEKKPEEILARLERDLDQTVFCDIGFFIVNS